MKFMPGSRFTNAQAAGWGADIYPFVKSTGVYKCPDDPTQATAPPKVPVSYLFNMMLGHFTDYSGSGSAHGAPLTLAQINTPASTSLLAEAQGDQADVTNTLETDTRSYNRYDYGIGKGVWGNPPYTGTSFPTVHTDGANWLACDGHVKFLRPNVVSLGEGYKTASLCKTPMWPQEPGR